MTIAETLAERVAAVTFESLPADAVHWAKVAILDTVGCILAGANEPCAQIIGRQATIGTTGGDCLCRDCLRKAAAAHARATSV